MRWLRVLLEGPETDAATKKTIDAAAVKAEAMVLVGEIRGNLDRLEDLLTLPDPTVRVDETPLRD